MRKFLVIALVGLMGLTAMARTGGWVDEIVIELETSFGAAVLKLDGNQLDVYAFGISNQAIFTQVQSLPSLTYTEAFGSYNDLTFNVGGPVFNDGRLNPFAVAEFREAVHWLIDREYIANEIMGGLAIPKYTLINPKFPDAVRYGDIMEEIEDYYAHNPAKAEQVMTQVMLDLGATKVGGKWTYGGKPVVIIALIRTEDERKGIGDYFSNLLEGLGFEVERLYRVMAEANPIWINGAPDDGLFHFYTGGWVGGAVSRDAGATLAQFHTGIVLPWPLYVKVGEIVPKDLEQVLVALRNRLYSSLEERRDLYEEGLWGTVKFANQVWLVDRIAFSPVRANVGLAADLAGGIYNNPMASYTLHFQVEGKPVAGGTMRMALPQLVVEPWNPIAGSNNVYDMMPIRMTSDYGLASDTNDGLAYPLMIEKAKVYVKEGLPVGRTHDWVELEFVSEINVPADAWYDWDAAAQKFITVGEKFPEGLTAMRKSVVTYPVDMKIPLHDGSTLSVGDFVMGMIIGLDRAKPESKIYDVSAVAGYNSFMSSNRGFRITNLNPLTIETYSQLWTLDAELMVSTWFPFYAQGPGFWHTITLGILAEEEKALTFSKAKSATLGVDWMGYAYGPSLPILAVHLDVSKAINYIPYAPTLGQYITADEAKARWANLEAWYNKMGHFWVASGPYYLDKVFTIEKVVTLKRFADYVYPADRFLFLMDN